jgi:hypothetical protein
MLRNQVVRVVFVAGLFLITAAANAGVPTNAKVHPRPGVTTATGVYHPMLINKVFNYYSNNGDGSYNIFSTDNEGFEFPKGGRLTTVFEDGVVWGAKQGGTVKVGGSVYRHALQAGPIIVNGTASALPIADDPSNPANRVYRVRRDMQPTPGVTDPNDPHAASQLGILLSDEVPLIGRYEAVTTLSLLQQYWDDWNSWPATRGAPYTDVNHDGLYDPANDIPGIPLADQTLWYVANDLDSLKTANLSGSSPIGLEMQKTVWAYDRSSALSSTLFSGARLINKSGVALDSMFIVQWSDPDVGSGGDDLVGCDTLLSLGYAYNGYSTDPNYGQTPPAVGFDLLQGPVVAGAPTDTALFGFARRSGFKNLPMSAFVFFTSGYAPLSDPVQGSGGYIEWFRLMNGNTSKSGAPFIDPSTGEPSRFVFSGDPVAGTGWNDGSPLVPSDRRMCVVTGPFTMAPGDTQEVVVACLAARGADRLSSITALKADARTIRQAYSSLTSGQIPPPMSYTIAWTGDQATLSFRADARGGSVSDLQINVKTYGEVVVTGVTLADDGMHNDGSAGDSILAGSVQISPQESGLQAEAVITYHNGNVITWAHIFDNISTAHVAVASYPVVSDNINNDGIPNPGENVRYTVSVKNASSVSLTNLVLTAKPVFADQQLRLATLSGNTTSAWTYDPNDPTTYLAFDVPTAYKDSAFVVQLVMTDGSHNIWRDTLVFPVNPLKSKVYTTPLQHVAGTVLGDFDITIVDSSRVKNHFYVIHGVDTAGYVGGYAVKDSTTGIVLLQNHPLPDALGHTSPIVDGFKVLLGTIDSQPGMKRWSIPSGTRRFSPVGGFAGVGLEGFSTAGDPDARDPALGTIGMAANFAFGGIGTTLGVSDFHTVLLKLAAVDNVALWDPKAPPTDDNVSRAYRYLRAANAVPADSSFAPWITNPGSGYPYQGYDYSVPFSAWDMETNPPTRLAVGSFENNMVGGFVDGRYWPGITTGDNSIAREFAFIFKSPYTTTADPKLAVNLINNASTPMMWVMTCARRSNVPWVAGDQFEIVAGHLPSSQDLWTFNPTIVTDVHEGSFPSSFAVLQNYPNPFNPSTTIRYEIPEQGKVSMKIYNVLGQEIRTLVDEIQNPGHHVVVWNSKNDDGSIVASGVYFCRCTATPSTRGRQVMQTMKMVLVK